MYGLMDLRVFKNSSLSFGEISKGIELFIINEKFIQGLPSALLSFDSQMAEVGYGLRALLL